MLEKHRPSTSVTSQRRSDQRCALPSPAVTFAEKIKQKGYLGKTAAHPPLVVAVMETVIVIVLVAIIPAVVGVIIYRRSCCSCDNSSSSSTCSSESNASRSGESGSCCSRVSCRNRFCCSDSSISSGGDGRGDCLTDSRSRGRGRDSGSVSKICCWIGVSERKSNGSSNSGSCHPSPGAFTTSFSLQTLLLQLSLPVAADAA